jgi:AraC-like DNA-binding protein
LPAVVAESWHRFDISVIDDLSNAVLAADLEAIQMTGGRVRGSLAFAARDGIVFSSGLIGSNVMMRGTLAEDAVTLGVLLRVGSGSRFWFNEVTDGDVGVVLPGEECDFLCTANSLYLAATLTPKQLRKEALRQRLTVHRNLMRMTGLHPTPLGPHALTWLRKHVATIHSAATGAEGRSAGIGGRLLQEVLTHYADKPPSGDGRVKPAGSARIVHDALDYIRSNLARSICIDALAEAVGTSRRSLYRAFSEILGDTPQTHARRLRLHRIRRELIANSRTTISAAAHHWGAGRDLGRLSRSYRDLFGENPSSTLASCRALRQADTRL